MGNTRSLAAQGNGNVKQAKKLLIRIPTPFYNVGETEEVFRACVYFVHDRMAIWHTLKNGEDSD